MKIRGAGLRVGLESYTPNFFAGKPGCRTSQGNTIEAKHGVNILFYFCILPTKFPGRSQFLRKNLFFKFIFELS